MVKKIKPFKLVQNSQLTFPIKIPENLCYASVLTPMLSTLSHLIGVHHYSHKLSKNNRRQRCDSKTWSQLGTQCH